MAITITLTDEQVGEVLKSFAAYMTGGSKHAPSIVQTIAPAKKRRERKIKAIVKEKNDLGWYQSFKYPVGHNFQQMKKYIDSVEVGKPVIPSDLESAITWNKEGVESKMVRNLQTYACLRHESVYPLNRLVKEGRGKWRKIRI